MEQETFPTQPKPSAGRAWASVAFALLGIALMGLALAGRKNGETRSAEAPATAAIEAVKAAEGAPGEALAQPQLEKALEQPQENPVSVPAVPVTPPRPKATQGAASIVRWTGPLAEGLELLESGKPAEALAWAADRAKPQDGTSPELTDSARALTGRAYLALGNTNDARTYFVLAVKGKTREAQCDGEFGLRLFAAHGKIAAISSEDLKALAVKDVPSWGCAMAALELAKRGEGKDSGQQALAPYQKALLSNMLELPKERECLESLNALVLANVLNPKVSCGAPKAVFHRVAPGDSLFKIAKGLGVEVGHLCRLNRLDSKAPLQVGQTLKALPGPVTLQVDRWRLTATLLIDGIYMRRFSVGIGPDDKTPSGTFTIRKKLVNPDWYYAGRRIPFGHAEHILGTRWLGFDTSENGGKGAGIGIHGTTKPESVPGRESKGCVRMLNADVEEVYDWMPSGARVTIN